MLSYRLSSNGYLLYSRYDARYHYSDIETCRYHTAMRQLQLQTMRLLAAASVLLIGAAIAMWPGRASAQAIPSTAAFACDFENNYCGFGEQSKVGDFNGARSSLV